MEDKEDIVIVGAGLVGCLLAANLCRNMNKRVTVSERYQVRFLFRRRFERRCEVVNVGLFLPVTLTDLPLNLKDIHSHTHSITHNTGRSNDTCGWAIHQSRAYFARSSSARRVERRVHTSRHSRHVDQSYGSYHTLRGRKGGRVSKIR